MPILACLQKSVSQKRLPSQKSAVQKWLMLLFLYAPWIKTRSLVVFVTKPLSHIISNPTLLTHMPHCTRYQPCTCTTHDMNQSVSPAESPLESIRWHKTEGVDQPKQGWPTSPKPQSYQGCPHRVETRAFWDLFGANPIEIQEDYRWATSPWPTKWVAVLFGMFNHM